MSLRSAEYRSQTCGMGCDCWGFSPQEALQAQAPAKRRTKRKTSSGQTHRFSPQTMVTLQRTVLLLLFAAGLSAQRTESTVLLDNGAVFQGFVVYDHPAYIDLELKSGRMRIYRPWIARLNGGPSDQLAIDIKESSEVPAEVIKRPDFPIILEEAAGRIFPLFEDIRTLEGRNAPETMAVRILEEVSSGSGKEAIARHVDAERVLSSAFPAAMRALTSYTRKIAVRQFERLLISAADPIGMRDALSGARITARLLSRDRSGDVVEVNIQKKGFPETKGILVIRNGKVVDLSNGPAPFPEIIRGLQAMMGGEGTRGLSLLESIDTVVSMDMARARRPRTLAAARGPASSTWTLIPARIGYCLELSWTWFEAATDVTPAGLDFLIYTADGRLGAAGLSERGNVGLDVLKQRFLEEAGQAEFETGESGCSVKEVRLDEVPVLRFQIEMKRLSQPVIYDVALYFFNGRIHQIHTFCASKDRMELSDEIDKFFKGLRIRLK